MEKVLGDVKVRVLKGDITKIQADAIVNPANSLMIMGGGVAGAIKRAGGANIEREALAKAPVRVGDAISTGAGRLPAKHVIHAPTMERPAMRIGVDNVYKATLAALKEAERLGVKTIAFPGMGTGVGGVDPLEAARAMVRAIKEHVKTSSLPKTILLVAFDDTLYRAFEDALREA